MQNRDWLVSAETSAPNTAQHDNITALIEKLASLRDAGVLTEAEVRDQEKRVTGNVVKPLSLIMSASER
jgi:hypothetical protein